MSLQTFVKVGAITNLSDARYCAGMGVDMLGFCLDPSAENFVDPATFTAITEWVAGVQVIGELDSVEPEAIAELRSRYRVDGLQLSHAANWAMLKSLNLVLICKVEWTPDQTLADFKSQYENISPYVDYFLLESEADLPAADQTMDQLQQIAKQYPVLLGFGIAQDTIFPILASVPVAGIALKGGSELRPGYKDFDKLAEILEILETA